MYFFLTKETLEAILLKFGFDITGLTLFESTVIFLIGNLFYLFTLMVISFKNTRSTSISRS